MKIAIFWPNWIGDAVMATPAVRAIRSYFIGASWINVLKPYVAGVLEGAPWQERQVVLDSKGPWSHRWPRVAARLRREKIDIAILFPNSFHAAWVAYLAGCGRRIGYRRYGRDMLLTDALPPVRDARGKLLPSPVLDAYNRLAERAGCSVLSRQMELFTTPQDELGADAVWDEMGLHRFRKVVCLNPGAAFGSAKFWPIEHFVSLARALADERGAGVLILCGPAERSLSREIAGLADRKGVCSLDERHLSLGLTKACIRRADLLITTDSGPRHFAAAFDRPVITLFGPTHIAWTETYYDRAIHLQKQVPCGPCQLRICPLDHRCMKLLTPAEVFAAVQSLLDERRTDRVAATLKPAG
jgi:heptosyltransferase-2